MPEIFPTGQPQLSEAQNDHVNRIRTAPMKGSLVIVVGAGVSQSATSRDGKPLSQLTWSGLILHGLNFLDSEGFLESDEKVDVDYYRSVLQRAPTSSNYSTNLLFAATYMKHKLEEHKKYVTWLELVFSNLRKHLHQTDILRELGGLQKMGAKLVTTNYDDLLDRFCNLRPIGPSNIYDLQMFTRAKQTQSALQAFFIAHTVLFVGSGGGMQDPNFGKLLKWATTHLSNIRNSHYILTRNEENIRYQPLNNVRYGPTYEHLVPFLHTLREPYNLFGVWKSVSIFDKNTGTVEESENDKPRAITTVSNGTPTGVLVYVLYDDRVQKFHMDYAGDPFGERPANFQAQWGSRGTGNGQFVEPLFIWASMCGEIYVTDTNNHRVQVFDAGGTYLRQWGTNGTGKGQFAKPWGNCGLDPTLDRRIPCNPKDVEIFVCDKDNKRVQIFNGLGEFKSMFSDKDWFEVSCIQEWSSDDGMHFGMMKRWGGYGMASGKYRYPEGIATCPATNAVYVVDADNHRVQAFTEQGNYIHEFGGKGSRPGEFDIPTALAVDHLGHVYVCDMDNARVQVFQPVWNPKLLDERGQGSQMDDRSVL